VTSTPTATNTPTQTSTPTPTSSAPILLLGDQTVEAQSDYNPPGMAEAFQYTAAASGSVNKLWIWVDNTNTATSIVVGLYTNSATGENASTLLAQGTVASPVKGAWNAVTVTPVSVAAGTKYWLAVLGPAGGGTPQFRDVPSGGKAQTSAQTNLALLPATWSSGNSYSYSPLSAYAQSP
jgi:hypothetical protein